MYTIFWIVKGDDSHSWKILASNLPTVQDAIAVVVEYSHVQADFQIITHGKIVGELSTVLDD